MVKSEKGALRTLAAAAWPAAQQKPQLATLQADAMACLPPRRSAVSVATLQFDGSDALPRTKALSARSLSEVKSSVWRAPEVASVRPSSTDGANLSCQGQVGLSARVLRLEQRPKDLRSIPQPRCTQREVRVACAQTRVAT